MKNNIIIITGVTGQIGSYMVDYILKNTDLDVFGAVRRISVKNHENISHIKDARFNLVEMDLSDSHSISCLIERYKPKYFINFAANSFVGSSWTFPVQHMEINAIGVLNQLEAIRKYSPETRYLNLGSSEEFGDVKECPQTEKTELRPRSPYGASKAAARFLVKVYKESYNLYALQVWNFNTEGERRGEEFVTRKISKGVARIKKELNEGKLITPLVLGNLDSRRDWQHSEDVCDALWKILNQPILRKTDGVEHEWAQCGGSISHLLPSWKPKEYVLSSNETHSIREFIEEAFSVARINIKNSNPDELKPCIEIGQKSQQINYTLQDGTPVVVVSPEFYRPAEVDILHGNSNAARAELGWSPKVDFKTLVRRMVEHDISRLTY